MANKKKPAAKTEVPVEANTHPADKRRNIPTRETLAFADEKDIRTAKLKRDAALDPQLVWTGKGDDDLEVPAVPVYVQEKIDPRAVIEDVKARSRAAQPVYDLFGNFNGLDDFSKKLEFYQHDQHWTNRLILGDSLLVMASLAERERLRGQVQCIYFDPPYGIKFGSNWQVSTRKRDVKDAKADDLTRQPEQIKAFRDTWELGNHSYLTYLRDRLAAARDLLTESGSIFVQIGDENVHFVRCLMDEVFGSENFVLAIVVKKTGSTTPLESVNDYLLWYAKTRGQLKTSPLYLMRAQPENDPKFNTLISPTGELVRVGKGNSNQVPELLGQGYVWARVNYPLVNQEQRPTRKDEFYWNGKRFTCGRGNHWRYDPETAMPRLAIAGRLFDGGGDSLGGVMKWSDWPYVSRTNIWDDTHGEQGAVYVVQTNRKVVERCLLMTTDPGDLVLDPTCGSGTTAYVAEQWGRRWITIDTSRVALALARTRLMTARYPYYLLADSIEGRKKQAELSTTPTPPDAPPPQRDMHKGFVYRTVPHVTLKSIANNPDIQPGMTRDQIDAAIRRHADTETLYDQPYEDKNFVRVTGPFTVESLSPHRQLPTPAEPHPAPEPTRTFLQLVHDNLRTAGVKGTTTDQRIKFARLDPFPGEYIQAEGETETGTRVRVSVGPEFGTVGDEWLGAAAREAMQGTGAEQLLVCGFAFEASVHERTAQLTKEVKYGKLRTLPVRMNPDMAMFGAEAGQELLKKTDKGNLFTVFGEPDVLVEVKAGFVTVTVRGVDVFDPSTGEVRTGGTDDIACWFIDTDYNGESFFVRHAYFLGSQQPYEKLQKALRAEIDEGEWAKLYRATSQPFDVPKTGKVAVKVINHFGDEVLKVYPVGGPSAATPVGAR
jgi:adenine-specific DNA-methyltransferase